MNRLPAQCKPPAGDPEEEPGDGGSPGPDVNDGKGGNPSPGHGH